MQSARMVTLPFILFELFPFELCASQKLCPLYNLKTTEAIFTNFIQTSTNMSRRAECKNSNSVFILFELFPLELCPSQKQLSMTILYQVMIVQ